MGIFASIASFFRGPRRLPPPPEQRGRDGIERRQLGSPTHSFSEWLISHLESAVQSADNGNLREAARLASAVRRDGVIQGTLSARTNGMLALPREITAAPEQQETAARFAADFDRMFPPSELEALVADGILLRVGIGEFVQEPWEAAPRLRRLDPEFLQYRWSEDRWYYASAGGLLPIKPGDGRWVLHLPGGAVSPWKSGLWMALGRCFIAKQTALFLRDAYANRLANTAAVATSPGGATLEERQTQLEQLVNWGPSASFALPSGWDIKLLESNGRGFETYSDIIDASEAEATKAIAGQSVTSDGGVGFANAAVFAAIRSDLIQADAQALAQTIIEQGLWVWGFDNKLDVSSVKLRWETTPPRDRNLEATASMQAASAVKAWIEAGADVDVPEMARRYGMALKPAPIAPPVLEPVDLIEDAEVVETAVEVEDCAAEELASKMTEYAVERCEHGYNNRCPRCGIERVRDFDVGPDGAHVWKVQWRATPQAPVVSNEVGIS